MKMRDSILVALMFVGAFLAMSAPAHAETVWRTWGSCPFAETRKDAMDRFEEAIKDMSMPEEVKAEFRKLIVTNSEKGSARTVKPGDHFQEMQSCKGHLMKGGVLVGEYLDTQGKTQEGHTIQATEWHVDYQGKRYTLTLPDTCFNWAWEVSDIPAPKEAPPPDCAELSIPTEPGDKLTVTVLPVGYLPPRSACYGIKQGDGPWTVPPCLTCFDVTTVGVTLGFDPDAITHEISVCIERTDKEGVVHRTCAIVVEPKDWVDNKFSIKPEWWVWDKEKCREVKFPAIS